MLKKSYLYIHLPFCAAKCSYCAFYSICDLSLIPAYVKGLKKELGMLAERYPVSLSTLYFGGGNPALLGAENLGALIKSVKGLFGDNIEEISMESNPENIDRAFVSAIKDIGVNRLSMGVQTFNNAALKKLGRTSGSIDVYKAIEALKACDFDNFNLDYIYGSPGYNLSDMEADLSKLVDLEPRHISAYALQVEEGTLLKKRVESGLYSLPSDETLEDEFDFVIDYLCSKGYKRYEISNYALDGYECRHNLAYWNYEDTLAAGASAVYTYSGRRVENVANVRKYLELLDKDAYPCGKEVFLSLDEQKLEFIMMNFRKTEGFEKKAYIVRYGTSLEEDFGGWVSKYKSYGFIVETEDRYYFSKAALNISSAILAELL